MSSRTFILLFCLLVPPLVPELGAQTASTISGTVHDVNGGVLPGVLVTATNSGTSLVRTSVTGPEGRYVIAALPPGKYEIRAELAGFKPHVQRDLELTISETLPLNITLQIGDLEIEDVVVGISPLVNTASSDLSYLVGASTIEQLPLNGRNYTDLALLQPGVLSFPHRDDEQNDGEEDRAACTSAHQRETPWGRKNPNKTSDFVAGTAPDCIRRLARSRASCSR